MHSPILPSWAARPKRPAPSIAVDNSYRLSLLKNENDRHDKAGKQTAKP
jgi:hypothetical protein